MLESAEAADEASEDQTEVTPSQQSPDEQLSSGTLLRGADLLTAREASDDLARAGGNLVVWAAERRTGKTTLTAELYERHRSGTAATRFAGTRTLLGLEERIHPARADSGRVTPHTPRTELDPEGRELIHLAVAPPPTQLLFADLPGEIFRRIRDNELPPNDVQLLGRADKLGILVDGERIARPAQRAAAVTVTTQLIARLADGGLPRPRTETRLILTKLDCLVEAGSPALEYWDTWEGELVADLRAHHAGASALRTAARGSRVEDDGMDELMRWLIAPTVAPADPPLGDLPTAQSRMQRLRLPKGLA